MKTLIRAARVITPWLEMTPGEVLIDGGTILGIGRPGFSGLSDIRMEDLDDATLIPGMIDIHNHGGLGHWVGDSPDAAVALARHLPSTGTTAWLPTVGSVDAVRNVVEAAGTLSRMIADPDSPTANAGLLGIHMEGPFLAPKNLPGEEWRGTPPADTGALEELLEAGKGLIRLVGVSPEMPGAMAFIRMLRLNGVNAAVAHTKAPYDLFIEAVEAGINHATHAFNVMTGLHHRRPGVVGGILTEESVMCELISDGYHVHPAAMRVLVACKGTGGICMITDNVHLAGLPDGTYGEALKKDGTIRKAGYDDATDGTLYGSAWPMNHNLSVLVNEVGVGLRDAVRMASTNPARVAGVGDRKGSIEPGKDADLVAIDASFNVRWTMVGGRVAHEA